MASRPTGSTATGAISATPACCRPCSATGITLRRTALIGRTAAFPDSNRDGRSALETLPLSIESHGPVQYIILMLGTNDCKIDKTRSAEDVGAGMDKLVRLVIGMLPAWTKILLVAPPPLGPSAPQRDPEYDAQSLAVSQGVAAQYQMIAEAYGLRFLDAGTVTQMSALDGEHSTPTATRSWPPPSRTSSAATARRERADAQTMRKKPLRGGRIAAQIFSRKCKNVLDIRVVF